MAFGRGLSTGGRYGRVEVIYTWAQEHWVEFDGWCCTQTIDPVGLSAYRFYNLAVFYIKEVYINETRTDEQIISYQEQLKALEETLALCDEIPDPFEKLIGSYSNDISVKNSSAVTDETPKPESRHKYIPPWYRGEDNAYKQSMLAKHGISTLPKMS